jgi:hypothetical protein
MAFSRNDVNILRELATRCREISDSDRNTKLKQRWTNLNDLKHDGPPMLLVSPEGAWKEIFATLPIECENKQAKEWERSLRQIIYQHDEIRDDRAYDPVFTVSSKISLSDYGIPFKRSQSDQTGGAYHDEPVLENLNSDLEKLHFREISVDFEETARNVEQATEILGDLLEVRTPPVHWWTCGLTWEAIKLLGLENFMMAMYDDPEGLHRLMKFLSGDMLNFITFCEHEKLLGMNTGGNLIGSGNLGYTTQLPPRDSSTNNVLLKNLWGFSESQETVGISPDMFAEFIYPYQQPLQEKFGLNYYGCCEPIEKRWDTIRQTPNLLCVSISPWSNQAQCAEQLGRDYVYCRKPNPAPVCLGFNEESIRKEFQETLTHAGKLNTVMILKDTHTIENKPERFARWVETGREIMGS